MAGQLLPAQQSEGRIPDSMADLDIAALSEAFLLLASSGSGFADRVFRLARICFSLVLQPIAGIVGTDWKSKLELDFMVVR